MFLKAALWSKNHFINGTYHQLCWSVFLLWCQESSQANCSLSKLLMCLGSYWPRASKKPGELESRDTSLSPDWEGVERRQGAGGPWLNYSRKVMTFCRNYDTLSKTQEAGDRNIQTKVTTTLFVLPTKITTLNSKKKRRNHDSKMWCVLQSSCRRICCCSLKLTTEVLWRCLHSQTFPGPTFIPVLDNLLLSPLPEAWLVSVWKYEAHNQATWMVQ